MGNAGRLRRVSVAWWPVSVLLFSICLTTAFAQVHIQETVPIFPVQPKAALSVGGASTHTIRFEFYWDTPYGARVYLLRPCSDSTVYGSGGSIIINITSAPAGMYAFEPQVNEAYGQGPDMHVSYRLFQDDSIVDSASATLAPYSGCCYTVLPGLGNFIQFTTTYYSGFKFYVFPAGGLNFIPGGPSGSGGSAGLELQGIDNCSGTMWTPDSDAVTYTIATGSQYVSFYNSSGKMGSSATVVGSNPYLAIVPDGLPLDSTGNSIIVLAQSGTVTSRDTNLLEPSYLDHFKAYLYPYTQHLVETPIGLEPLNIYNHDIDI